MSRKVNAKTMNYYDKADQKLIFKEFLEVQTEQKVRLFRQGETGSTAETFNYAAKIIQSKYAIPNQVFMEIIKAGYEGLNL